MNKFNFKKIAMGLTATVMLSSCFVSNVIGMENANNNIQFYMNSLSNVDKTTNETLNLLRSPLANRQYCELQLKNSAINIFNVLQSTNYDDIILQQAKGRALNLKNIAFRYQFQGLMDYINTNLPF